MKINDLIIQTLSMDHAELLLDYYSTNRIHLEKWEPKRVKNYYTQNHFSKKIHHFISLSAKKSSRPR